jgi:arabinofuranosyltransferase
LAVLTIDPIPAATPPAQRVPRLGRETLLRLVNGVVLLTAPALWFAFAWQRRWITDDGLIAARTVRQILAGNGPVFNPGERVEANTSVLWTWLLAGISWVSSANVYTVMMWTGLLTAPLGLLFALLGARAVQRRRNPGRPLLPLGALVVAALPPFWDFATSGLEESLIFCWLGLCWWLLAGVHPDSPRRVYGLAFTAGLGWLVRPDMALGTACLLTGLWFAIRPGKRRAAALLATAAALPLAYEVFRMGYYGLLVPNTAVVKEATATDVGLGLKYLTDFASPYHLWIPALLLAATAPFAVGWRQLDRTGRAAVGATLAAGFLMAGYVVAIGGDFMHARMLLPGTFALLMPVAAVPLPERVQPRRLAAAALGTALLLTWSVACMTSWRVHQIPGMVPGSGITDERAFWVSRTGVANPTDAGPFVAMIGGDPHTEGSLAWSLAGYERSKPARLVFLPPGGGALTAIPLNRPGVSVAVPGDILGSLGALVPLDGVAVDIHGLSYALGSHFEPGAHGRIGHGKAASPEWIVADYSTAGAIPGLAPAKLAAARRALSCGGMAELRQATEKPLTWNRFWGNVGGALTLTDLRIPNDPRAADHLFCPGGA